MSRLSLSRLIEIAKDELGAAPGTLQSIRDLSTNAGTALMNARPWAWAEGRSVTLRPRALISLTDATWTEATKTLTKVGAFADYSFLSGDTVGILGGTGATVGTYEVASKTSSDAIVLTTSIGSAADGSTDIEGEMPNDQIALPDGFDILQITGYSAPDTLVSRLEFTSPQTMLDLRGYPNYIGTTIGFWALLRHVRSSSGGSPVQRLDLWPRTEAGDEALTLYYRTGWLEPLTDEEQLSIPNWLDPVYIETFKAVVMGTEEPRQGTIDQRLAGVFTGIQFLHATQVDSTMQQSYGPMGGGWLDVRSSPATRYQFPPNIVTDVSGP